MKQVVFKGSALVLVLGMSSLGCDLIPKKATDADCEKWAAHLMEVIKSHVESRFDNDCEADAATKKLARKTIIDMLDKKSDQFTSDFTGKCSGESYKPKDAKCLMGAETIDDMKKCDWGGSKDIGKGKKQIDEGLDKICGTGKGKKDDDGGKKKKKDDDDK